MASVEEKSATTETPAAAVSAEAPKALDETAVAAVITETTEAEAAVKTKTAEAEAASLDKVGSVFPDLDVDQLDVNVIESLCMNCGQNGTTRLMLTRIPFYREIVISSFHCKHCDFSNNQLDPATEIKKNGTRYTLTIKSKEDLNRYVITTNYTCIQILDLDFEMPPLSHRGQVTTVESILSKASNTLTEQKKVMEQTHPDLAAKMGVVINGLIDIITLKNPVPIIFEDATGNVFVSNPNVPNDDPGLKEETFIRDSAQNKMIGLSTEENAESLTKPLGSFNDASVDEIDEVVQFNEPCANCQAICETNMKVTDIPYFKQVVIMATVCDECGYRNNEVKSGGGIEKQGMIITVTVSTPEDLNRDILKSETCSLRIPQIDFETSSSSLSGRFTTIEGLIVSLHSQLKDTCAVFYGGDSYSTGFRKKTKEFLDKLDKIRACKLPVDIILTDPAGNSYIQSLSPPDLDPKLKIVWFDRTPAQNEELGLNDMKVNNYE